MAAEIATPFSILIMPQVDFAELTDTGCVREHNEDAIASWPFADGLLFAVADGLGGAAAGEVASTFALDVLRTESTRTPPGPSVAKVLRQAVHQANLKLYQRAIAVPELRGMATTLTATTLTGNTLVAAHVGDSRLLLLRDGALRQLTKDHTWVAQQMQYGLLSAAQARVHPNRHMLTRSLGRELLVSVDVLTLTVQPGDLLVQCSDGIHGAIADDELAELVRDRDPASGCQTLIERARDAGAPDNASVQIAIVTDCEPAAPARRWWRGWR